MDTSPAYPSPPSSSSLPSPCPGGKLVFEGRQPALAVDDGAEVELGGKRWRARCDSGALWLSHITISDNRLSQRMRLVDNTRTELARRRQDLEDLRTEQTQLLDQVDDEQDFDSQAQRLKCITLARHTHQQRIDELECMQASGVGQVDVTLTEARTTVRLPAGVLAASEHVSGGLGGAVWLPKRGERDGGGVERAVEEESKAERVVRKVVSLSMVGGLFVRAWGSEGSGEGEFNRPSGVAVSGGGEVLVCGSDNHRVQVFGLDGSFKRAWG